MKKLAKQKKLHDSGIISPEEYQRLKKALIEQYTQVNTIASPEPKQEPGSISTSGMIQPAIKASPKKVPSIIVLATIGTVLFCCYAFFEIQSEKSYSSTDINTAIIPYTTKEIPSDKKIKEADQSFTYANNLPKHLITNTFKSGKLSVHFFQGGLYGNISQGSLTMSGDGYEGAITGNGKSLNLNLSAH